MRERKSNLELLRIVLMCVIPVYHLMVYNGVYYVNSGNAVLALILTVGGAIPADYAFMALSSYFMLQSGKERSYSGVQSPGQFMRHPVVKRFMYTAAQVLTLYLVKVVVLRAMFGYNNTEYFVDFFLMRGAWWYIYPYLVLSLIYPLLNSLISRATAWQMNLMTAALGIVFIYNGVVNHGNFVNDMEAFLFIYCVMAVLKRSDYRRFLMLPTDKYTMFAVALVCYSVMLAASLYVKISSLQAAPDVNAIVDGLGTQGIIESIGDIIRSDITDATSKGVTNYIIGRYHFVSMIMGIAVFLAFKDIRIEYNPAVNRVAAAAIYVFLLHDTIMGIFWKAGKCWNDYGYYSTAEFLLWMTIYVVSAWAVAMVMSVVYERMVKPLWSVLIERISG